MKSAPGKHGSAMPEKVAKKIQRRNERRFSKAELHAEANEVGLAPIQVEYFRKMLDGELQDAFREAKRELYSVEGFPESPARTKKVDSLFKRVEYIKKLLKEKQG